MTEIDLGTSWTATITGKAPDNQIFLRRNCNGAQVVVCVGLDGFDYNKQYQRNPLKWRRSTRGKNIHLALNSGAQFTFEEFEELYTAIDRATLWLARIEP